MSTETKFTPGPLEALPFDEAIGEWAVYAYHMPPGGKMPAVCGGKSAEANAKLYAAAPDLLEALAFYVSICGNTAYAISRETAEEMYAKGTAALNKALGK